MFWAIHVMCMMNGICSMPFFRAVVNADDAQSRRHLVGISGRSVTGFRCRKILNMLILTCYFGRNYFRYQCGYQIQCNVFLDVGIILQACKPMTDA